MLPSKYEVAKSGNAGHEFIRDKIAANDTGVLSGKGTGCQSPLIRHSGHITVCHLIKKVKFNFPIFIKNGVRYFLTKMKSYNTAVKFAVITSSEQISILL